MKSVLEDFAYGNISSDLRSFRKDSRFGRTMKKLTDSESKLYAVLNEQEKELLKNFADAQAEINLLSCVDRFICGYRLGVLMTAEIYNDAEDLIAGG